MKVVIITQIGFVTFTILFRQNRSGGAVRGKINKISITIPPFDLSTKIIRN